MTQEKLTTWFTYLKSLCKRANVAYREGNNLYLLTEDSIDVGQFKIWTGEESWQYTSWAPDKNGTIEDEIFENLRNSVYELVKLGR